MLLCTSMTSVLHALPCYHAWFCYIACLVVESVCGGNEFCVFVGSQDVINLVSLCKCAFDALFGFSVPMYVQRFSVSLYSGRIRIYQCW